MFKILCDLVIEVGGFNAVWGDHFKPSTCPHAIVYQSPFGGGTRQYIYLCISEYQIPRFQKLVYGLTGHFYVGRSSIRVDFWPSGQRKF